MTEKKRKEKKKKKKKIRKKNFQGTNPERYGKTKGYEVLKNTNRKASTRDFRQW
jgi:hypothetical protein